MIDSVKSGEAVAQALLATGQILLVQGDSSAALESLSRLRRNIPGSDVARDALLVEGSVLRLRGNAKQALELGITVHTIGIGLPQGAPIPVYSGGQKAYREDKQGETIRVAPGVGRQMGHGGV